MKVVCGNCGKEEEICTHLPIIEPWACSDCEKIKREKQLKKIQERKQKEV